MRRGIEGLAVVGCRETAVEAPLEAARSMTFRPLPSLQEEQLWMKLAAAEQLLTPSEQSRGGSEAGDHCCLGRPLRSLTRRADPQ